MNPKQTPFPAKWLSFNLRGYRECNSTYCAFPYESVPPLNMDLFRGEFQWLTELEPHLPLMEEGYGNSQQERAALATSLNQLVMVAKQMNLQLPDAFLKFMTTPYLQSQIPSCTCCYFDLPQRIIKSPFGDDGYFIRFLNDQQCVLLWYLYLKPNGDHCVVVSPVFLDYESADEFEGDFTAEAKKESTYFCAPTFETFMYRFWTENKIWFALYENRPLTKEQQAYMNHYKT